MNLNLKSLTMLLMATTSFEDVIEVLKWAVEHTIIQFGDVNQTGESNLDVQIGYFFRVEAMATGVTIYTVKNIAEYIGLENVEPDGHLSEHIQVRHPFQKDTSPMTIKRLIHSLSALSDELKRSETDQFPYDHHKCIVKEMINVTLDGGDEIIYWISAGPSNEELDALVDPFLREGFQVAIATDPNNFSSTRINIKLRHTEDVPGINNNS